MVEDMVEDMVDVDEDTQKGKYLTFFIEKEIYGMDIRLVTEIIGIQPITEVPEVPDFVKGIINLRGRIIPVMDMRRRFKKEDASYTDRTCVIVIENQGIPLGLIVDEVSEVLPIADDAIVPPPELKTSPNKYIKGLGKAEGVVILLLDCEKFFEHGDEVVLTKR